MQLKWLAKGNARRSAGRRNPARTALLDDLVGAGEEHRRHGEPERFCRLEVYHQLEPSRLFDRQAGRLGALQNLVNQDRRPPVYVGLIEDLGHQPAVVDDHPANERNGGYSKPQGFACWRAFGAA